MWGTDVMPEYKLMVKDDKALEERIEKSIEELENKDNKKDDSYKPLRYN
jgi:Txe/YoeB family toxin of Txe-Axe toxin-antitoxin module